MVSNHKRFVYIFHLLKLLDHFRDSFVILLCSYRVIISVVHCSCLNLSSNYSYMPCSSFSKTCYFILMQCIVPKYSWRWLVGATSLPSVLALVFYRRIPQSPTFLSSQGDLNGALTILEQVARRNRKELPEGQLVHDRINESADTQVEHNDDADSDTPSAIRSNPVDIEDAPTLNDPLLGNRIDGDPKRKLAISIILSREWIRITVLIWLLYFGNSFSYRGLILLLSPSFSEAPILQYEVHKNPSYYFDTLIISCAGTTLMFSWI